MRSGRQVRFEFGDRLVGESELVVLAAKRAKQLLKGAKPLIESDNRAIVIALREISAGKIRRASAES